MVVYLNVAFMPYNEDLFSEPRVIPTLARLILRRVNLSHVVPTLSCSEARKQ